MRIALLLIALTLGVSANSHSPHLDLPPRDVCNADDCARAVTGTVFGPEGMKTHQMDCSSFFDTTVVPIAVAPTTTTLTDRSACLAVTTPTPALTPQTIIPTAVPAYASYCTGTAHYSSACSCWGFIPSISTAPATTVTSTVCYPLLAPGTSGESALISTGVEESSVANSGGITGGVAPSRTWTLPDFSAGGKMVVASNCVVPAAAQRA